MNQVAIHRSIARLSSLVFALALAAAPACSGKNKNGKKKDEGGETVAKPEKPAEPVPPPAPSFDAAALQARLQGTWNTGANPDKPVNTFVIRGEEAEVTTHNMIDSATGKPSVYKGKLEITGPNEFAIRLPDGMGYSYNFVDLAGTLHISAAEVYPVATLDAFRIELGMGEFLERTAAGCKWSIDFAGKNDSKDVPCAVAEQDGKQVFTYQSPDRFDPDKLADNRLLVADGYLVTEQMMEEVATKAE